MRYIIINAFIILQIHVVAQTSDSMRFSLLSEFEDSITTQIENCYQLETVGNQYLDIFDSVCSAYLWDTVNEKSIESFVVDNSIKRYSNIIALSVNSPLRELILPVSICELKKLEMLSIVGIIGNHTFPKSIKRNNRLKYIHLVCDSGSIMEELPKSIINLENLEFLVLHINSCTRKMLNSIASLSKNKSIIFIYLHFNECSISNKNELRSILGEKIYIAEY